MSLFAAEIHGQELRSENKIYRIILIRTGRQTLTRPDQLQIRAVDCNNYLNDQDQDHVHEQTLLKSAKGCQQGSSNITFSLHYT